MDTLTPTTYTIGQVAEMFNLSVSTLRYYDQEGLIPGLQKNAAGVRQFDQRNINAINIIECLKRSGMSIKDIKQLMGWCVEGDDTLELRLEMFQNLKQQVLNQMAELQATLDTIDYKCHYYQQAVADGTEKYVAEASHHLDTDNL